MVKSIFVQSADYLCRTDLMCKAVLTLLDTRLRVNELINLKMENVWLDEGLIKVLEFVKIGVPRTIANAVIYWLFLFQI